MTWSSLTLLLAVSTISVFVAVTLLLKCAAHWQLGGKPNGRDVRSWSTPHLGGIGIASSVIIAVAMHGLLDQETVDLLGRILPGLSILIILGLLDDLRSLKAVHKLVIQVLAATLMVSSGFRLIPGIAPLDSLAVLIPLVTVLYLVGVSNSINLIDGHDGLAAGLCLISSSSFFVVGLEAGATQAVVLSLAVFGACGGFLYFNFPPGKIFMGDTGSMFLGMLLGVVSASLTMINPSVKTLAAVALMMGVPMLDTFLAIARRVARKQPVFQADSLHIHHLLRSSGLTERQTLSLLYSLQGILALLGVAAFYGYLMAILVGAALVSLLFGFFLRWMISAAELQEELERYSGDAILRPLDRMAK